MGDSIGKAMLSDTKAMRNLILIPSLAAVLLSLAVPAFAAPTSQEKCASLNQTYFTTESGLVIVASEFIATTKDYPEHCHVTGFMQTALVFEMRLPTLWNQRVLYVGGGGFDGAVPQLLVPALTKGYTVVGSNGGHVAGSDESWAYDNNQLFDFAHFSVHKTLTAAREIVSRRYQQSALKTYFEGCSNGGREALIQAQRFPGDFDGIIARAPAWNFVELMLAGNQSARRYFGSSAAQLPQSKLNLLSAASLAKCDMLDNAKDNIISNVAACRTVFNPASLRCAGADNDSCLTDAQIATVTAQYSVFSLNTSPPAPYYIGWPAGGEAAQAGWPFWVTSLATGLPNFSSRFIQFFLQQGANYNALNFVPENNLPLIANRIQMLDASATDYSAYRARGGKLILWHGTVDWAISFNSTAAYYSSVVQANGGQAIADQFVEFFPAPGVQHCFGGEGADYVDLLTPLKNWVENGIAPSQQNMVSAKIDYNTGTIKLTRPVCKFPKYPRFLGGTDAQRDVWVNYQCN